ncbi:MAG: VanZ family protein [bacterium]
MNRRLFASYWLPVIAYAALILAVSSIPGSALAKLPFSFWDKSAHVVEYGILSLLAGRAVRATFPGEGSSTRVALAVIAAVVAFGAIDEIYQGTRGRDADILDLAADAAGATLAQTIQTVRARGARGRCLSAARGESGA